MKTETTKKIKILSFFAGIGFLDLGFSRSGFDVAFVNEANPDFLDAYKFARRGEREPVYGYSTESAEVFLDEDIWHKQFPCFRENDVWGIIGGPPCPDFSCAGKNAGCDGKNGILTKVYFDLICKHRPSFFVFENVKGLYRTQKHRLFYDEQKERLKQAGYVVFDSIENALCYGVPQNRDRLILVGFRASDYKRTVTFDFQHVRKYDLNEVSRVTWPKTSSFSEKRCFLEPQGIIRDLTVEYWFKKNNVAQHPNQKDFFQPQKMERFVGIREGDVSRKSFKRLHRWRYAPTSAYGNNEVHLHPYRRRRISVAEALAIQSIPSNFVVKHDLSLSSKFKMVGNGVPFLLAEGVARNLYFTISTYLLRGKKYA